jgi:hypothetical protein
VNRRVSGYMPTRPIDRTGAGIAGFMDGINQLAISPLFGRLPPTSLLVVLGPYSSAHGRQLNKNARGREGRRR